MSDKITITEVHPGDPRYEALSEQTEMLEQALGHVMLVFNMKHPDVSVVQATQMLAIAAGRFLGTGLYISRDELAGRIPGVTPDEHAAAFGNIVAGNIKNVWDEHVLREAGFGGSKPEPEPGNGGPSPADDSTGNTGGGSGGGGGGGGGNSTPGADSADLSHASVANIHNFGGRA